MATAKKAQPKKAPPKTPTTLELWNKVCVTDPAFTKKADTRGGFTSINATWQAWQATELWGPYGKLWGVRKLNYTYLGPQEKPFGLSLLAEFFCPVSEFEIATDMPYAPNSDCCKKLLTDLTTKALSKLGFSADVFFGLYDDNRYLQGAAATYAAHRGAQAPAEVPDVQPDPPPPPPAEKPPEGGADGMFLNAFSLPGLHAAVVERLFKTQKPLLKKFMPNEESTKQARATISDLVKLHMSEDDTMIGDEIQGMVAEQFFHNLCAFMDSKIKEREEQ